MCDTVCIIFLGLVNGSYGNLSVTCRNPQIMLTEPTTQPTTMILKPSRTYIVSSVANHNNDAVATKTSHVTTTSVDSTFKESSNIDSDKQICNLFFHYFEIIK